MSRERQDDWWGRRVTLRESLRECVEYNTVELAERDEMTGGAVADLAPGFLSLQAVCMISYSGFPG